MILRQDLQQGKSFEDSAYLKQQSLLQPESILAGQQTLQSKSNNNNNASNNNNNSKSNSMGHPDPITIDRFKFLNLIGAGAYAKVFLVRKKDTQRVYALKIVKKKKLIELNQTHRVILERDILTHIEPHPFIIKLHYTFQNESKFFFALDFCPGGELFTILNRKGTFDEEHLKPENVILDKDGYVRISDFGLSKPNIISDHSTNSFCGTPAYLAPEILNQQGHGKPVDWWTLGNMIYEMLTGLPAFYVENQFGRDALFEKIRTEEITLSQKFSKPCRDIVSLLFQKNPLLRLGCRGAEEIKDHPWFADVEWDRMLNKEYRAPFIPKLKNDTDEFVEQPLDDSYQENEVYHEFPNFSFSGSLKDQSNPFISAKMDIE